MLKKTPKRQPGRPKKAPHERAEQFSISLTPPIRFGLEVLARDRDISLSQAVDYALRRVLRDHQVDGRSVLEIAERVSMLEEARGPRELFDYGLMANGRDLNAEEAAAVMGKFFLDTGLLQIRAMPERLRKAHERLLVEVVEGLPEGLWADGELVRNVVQDAFKDGKSAPEAVDELVRIVGATRKTAKKGRAKSK